MRRSLAKREEEIYLPGIDQPIRLDRRNEGLRLLQQVRDVARAAGVWRWSRRTRRMASPAVESARTASAPARRRPRWFTWGSILTR